jgi:hypothetical protein
LLIISSRFCRKWNVKKERKIAWAELSKDRGKTKKIELNFKAVRPSSIKQLAYFCCRHSVMLCVHESNGLCLQKSGIVRKDVEQTQQKVMNI